jgi:hypothetical protein
MRNLVLGLSASLLMLGGTTASATLSYSVSDASGSCGGHGLWTAGSVVVAGQAGGCTPYFSVDATQSTFVIDENNLTAALDMRVDNNVLGNVHAIVDLDLGGFAEAHNPYKLEGGLPYLAANDGSSLPSPLDNLNNYDIDFFTTVSGNIKFYLDDVLQDTVDIDAYAGGHAFQWGLGANAKSQSAFGGSAWLIPDGFSGHWDLNLTFTSIPGGARVPEPATLGLTGLALLAFARGRRRRQLAG